MVRGDDYRDWRQTTDPPVRLGPEQRPYTPEPGGFAVSLVVVVATITVLCLGIVWIVKLLQ